MMASHGERFTEPDVGGPPGGHLGGQPWAWFMAIALEEAAKAASLGEVPVGAIVLDEAGGILSRSGNRMHASQNPLAHAELLALREAAIARGERRLSGCTLVVTLEPCLMCAGAITHSRLSGLVFGAADAQWGAIISRSDYYDLPASRRELWHLGGVRSAECAALLKNFFRPRRQRQP